MVAQQRNLIQKPLQSHPSKPLPSSSIYSATPTTTETATPSTSDPTTDYDPAINKKVPNWAEFYKNGYPTDVIVISDDDGDDGEEENDSPDVIVTSTCPSPSKILKRKRLNVPPVARRKRACPSVEFLPPVQPVVKARDVYVPPVYDRKSSGQVTTVDDNDGHLIIGNETTLADGRFVVHKVLGQGTFGKVVSAFDTKNKTLCAVKIIRAVQKYRDASKIELRVLSTLATYDRNNRNRFIHLRECFDYKNHICIVTDLLGMSIFDFLRSNHYLAFPPSHVQSFARQLISSLAFLRDLNLVHTDLKPENILLKNDTSFTSDFPNHEKYKTHQILNDTSIHLIDFGSAVFNDEYHNSVVSTRHYRAPEIILGVGWSYPCDMWSIGCILVEFCTGEVLFQTRDNLEHLALMQRVIGKPLDRALLRAASLNDIGAELLNSSGKINYPNSQTKKSSTKHVKSTRTLAHIIRGAMPHMEADDMYWKLFLDLLSKIFVYDPQKRITAREALNHPWLTTAVRDVNI